MGVSGGERRQLFGTACNVSGAQDPPFTHPNDILEFELSSLRRGKPMLLRLIVLLLCGPGR